MMQQINLYKVEKKKRIFEFYFSQMLLAVWIFLGVILLVTVYSTFSHLSIQKKLNALGEEQLKKTQKLQGIEGKIPEEKTRNEIIAEVKKYVDEKQEKESMLSLLTLAETNKISGFSGYFKALSIGMVQGVWLTHIIFKDNGGYISLEGKASSAAYIPKLIASLANESVFKGKTFQLFKVAVDEKTNQADFILETKVDEQP